MNPAQKALWFIESHLADELTLDEIAGIAGISRFHMVRAFAAATGLSVLFHAVPTLYMAVKLVGALYLIWLGVSLFRAKAQGDAVLPGVEPKSARRAFFESITVEVLNPKTAIFFMAFLPQFIDASAAFPVWLQFVVLGTIVNLMFSSADIMCVFLAGAVIGRLRRSSRAQRLMQRAGGTVLVGLGVHVALQKA